jgi:hypothetical protein
LLNRSGKYAKINKETFSVDRDERLSPAKFWEEIAYLGQN